MAKNISKGDLRKQDFLVLKQSRDGTVTNVVAPNGLQVGLSDDRFSNSLIVKGGIEVSKGKQYLTAGANILLETDSEGQITIATSIDDVAVQRTKKVANTTSCYIAAGTDILISGAGFNTIGFQDTDRFIDIYHNGKLMVSGTVSNVTNGIADYYIKPTSSEVVFGFDVLLGDQVVTSVIASGSANVAAAGDALSLTNNVYHVNVATDGGLRINSDSLSTKLKTGGALEATSNGLAVRVDNLTTLGSGVDAANDKLLIYDANAGVLKAVAPNLIGASAALDIASAGGPLNENTLASGDLLGVADVDNGNAVKKITVEDFGQYLAAASNSGIGDSSGKLTMDINNLAAASVNVAEDFIAFSDEGTANDPTKKISIANFSQALAGVVTATGLNHSAGTLKVDIDSQTDISTNAHSNDTLLIYDDDAGVLKKIRVNNLQTASAAPPGAQYVTLTADGTLSNERVLTAGDGITKTDNGAGSTVVLDVDVTDFIDTSHGLKEASNNIQLALKSTGGLTFHSDGTLKLDYGTSTGLPAQGSNTVQVIAGDGLKTGGTVTIGDPSASVQLDINASDFAGASLITNSGDLDVYLGAGNNITITTASAGSESYFVISADLSAGEVTAGAGLDLSVGGEFSLDLAGGGGLKIADTELAVEPADFVGNGLEDDGADNLAVKRNTTQGAGYAPVHVNANGVSVQYDNSTIHDDGNGQLRVKDSGITNAKLANSSLSVVGGDGLRGGGSVSLGASVQLDIDVSDFAGTGLKDEGSENLAIDDSVVATLSGSVFSGHIGVTGSIHAISEISGSSLKAPVISGSLTRLHDGTSFIIAGPNIAITTGSSGAITIEATGLETGDITAVNTSTGLTGGGSAGDLTLGIDNSIIATLTGSVFSGHVGVTGSIHSTTTVSGSLLKANYITGSLTKISGGSSYLIAGPNISISTGSSGAVTISGTGAGSLIGSPEDGVYSDGLFTDFADSTLVGTAVDRFNEVLKALAPTPAPDLDNLDCNTSAGVTAFLSFGSSNDQSSASPAYISSNTAAGFSAVNVNGSYAAATSGNNIRKGIYNGAQVISGDLNEDVSQNNNGSEVNFVANSFGNGDVGTLKLEVNGSVIHSLDLTGSLAGNGVPGGGNKSQLNSNSSGFINLSQTGSAVLSNGDNFPSFQHRTGQYQIGTADQRNGWNYARVVHTVNSIDKTTNYVEWVNDNNNDALSAAGNSISFAGAGSIHLSGVEYFTSGTIEYKSRVSNAYKYIHDNTAIQFPVGNSALSQNNRSFSLSNQSKPTINHGAGENHAKILHLTASAAITADYFISGAITAGVTVTHPRKSDLTNGGQSTISPVLMYNLSNTSTNLSETFRRENFRLVSGSYNAQSNVTDSNNSWNSEIYMTASNAGHSNGLQFFDRKLVSPLNTLNSGNFSNFSNGPSQNPNYSGVSGTRTFHRYFRNETGSNQYDLSLNIQGSGTIVAHGTALDASKISILVKLPGKTGWMDVAGTFVLDLVVDNAGASAVTTVISKDTTLNAINYINFGNIPIADDEYVVVCVKADESWTGNISSITVSIGAGTGTLSAVPDLDDIDCDQDGTDANLSFGSSKAISGLTNPTTAAGFTAANINDLYQTAANSNNLRRAIFSAAQTLEGDLNEDVSSPGNDFVANAFSDANTGSLRLEVNGNIIHEFEITGSTSLVGAGNPGSGTDTNLNSDGSGFISLSNWGPGMFDNGVPRYSEIQRTGKYRIVSGSQRDGWNYARVLHVGTWGTRATNYVEWIVDANNEALASAGNGLSIFGDNSFAYLSGVKYFTSPSGSILTRVSNIYKNVYSDSNSAISFTSLSNCSATKIIQSGSGLSSTKTTNSSTDSLQTLSTTVNSETQLLHVSGTIDFSRSKSLPGAYTTAYNCAAAMVFVHPLKTNLTIPTQTTTNLLVWTPSDTSNANTDEYFTGESYRLVDSTYGAQSDVSGGSKNWNSQTSMNDNGTHPTHATGLLIYDTYLIPPKDGGSSGDFRNHDEGGGIESPAGNVNYSSGVLTHATRNYVRSFRNNTADDRPSVQITLYGDAALVGKTGPNAASLGANKNIFVEVAVPGKTAFLDLGKPSAGAGNYSAGDGCLSGDLNAAIDSNGETNTCTFNGVTADGTTSTSGEYIVIKISASKNWTGYLDRINVSWS